MERENKLEKWEEEVEEGKEEDEDEEGKEEEEEEEEEEVIVISDDETYRLLKVNLNLLFHSYFTEWRLT